MTETADPPREAREGPFYPPFPPVPAGVNIIPYKDFKPKGIVIQLNPADDAIEVDAEGIETVPIRVKHATDENKSGTKPKKKKKKKGPEEPAKRLTWWEVWEEGEDLRVTRERYAPEVADVDRFCMASDDFRSSRQWPPISLKISEHWDAFRLYTGLLSNEPSFSKSKGKGKTEKDDGDDDFYSDDEDAKAEPQEEEAEQQSEHAGPAPISDETPRFEEIDDDAPMVFLDEKERKVDAFLKDPELSLKIFFSSYMRDKGLIYSKPNLTNIPRLVGFFISFLLRNRVLPNLTAKLEAALKVTQQALKELPMTAKVGERIPDEFSQGCELLWGKTNGGSLDAIDFGTGAADDVETSKGESKAENFATEGDIKRAVFAEQVESGSLRAGDEATAAAMNASNVASGWAADSQGAGGWGHSGAGDSAWGSGGWGAGDNAESNGWGDPTRIPPDAADLNSWAGDAGEKQDQSWARDTRPLTAVVEPTGIPRTHEPGLVEWSLRRVKAIYPPDEAPAADKPKKKKRSGGKKASEPDAADDAMGDDGHIKLAEKIVVEPKKQDKPLDTMAAQELEERLLHQFGRLVLEPWLNWDRGMESDISRPSMISTPEGAAPHDPFKDEITVLVQPEVANGDVVHQGMGLGATWVQIAPKAGQGGKPESNGRFWYMEELIAIFPSFYVQPEND